MMSESITITPTLAQLETLERFSLTLRYCTALEESPSTLYAYRFNDNDVQCFVITTTGDFKIETRDFESGSGWHVDARCYGCDYPTDELTETTHEDETVLLCKECLA